MFNGGDTYGVLLWRDRPASGSVSSAYVNIHELWRGGADPALACWECWDACEQVGVWQSLICSERQSLLSVDLSGIAVSLEPKLS